MTTGVGGEGRVSPGATSRYRVHQPGATEGLSEVGVTLWQSVFILHYWTSIRWNALFLMQRDTGKLSGCNLQLIRGKRSGQIW